MTVDPHLISSSVFTEAFSEIRVNVKEMSAFLIYWGKSEDEGEKTSPFSTVDALVPVAPLVFQTANITTVPELTLR